MATKETPTKRDAFVKKIEAELTCAICLARFDDPKVLPCLHTYCRKCVESMSLSGKIVCPLCREEHLLPEGGAGKLLTSFTFTNLVQVLEVHEADQSGSSDKKLTCENGLDSNPAAARCLDCDAYLCSSCVELHIKQISSRNHEVVTLDEIKEKGDKCFQRPQHCNKHSKEVLKLYCRTCSKPICGDCTYVDHRTHNYEFLSDVQEELKETLMQKVTDLKQLVEEAKVKKEKVDALLEKHKTNVADIHAEIDKKIGMMMVILKKQQTELHKQVDTEAKQAEKAISADVESAELALVRLTSSVKFTERLLQTASDAEIATILGQAVEQCEKLGSAVDEADYHHDLLQWGFSGIQESSHSIGNVKVKSTGVPMNKETRVDLVNAPVDVFTTSRVSSTRKKAKKAPTFSDVLLNEKK